MSTFSKILKTPGSVGEGWVGGSSMCGTLAPMTSRRQIQDGGPHDVRSKMAAPMTSGPRWRPPRHQDDGPHDVRSKMAAPTKSDTRWRPVWRVRLHLGGWVNALDHEKVASRPRARCRSSIYKGEGPLMYRTNTDLEESILRISGWFFYAVQNEIQSLMV